MSAQTPQPENIEPKTIEPDNAALSEQPRRERISGLVSSLPRFSITQMALVILVAVFFWQWQAGHRALSDIRQQLANTHSQDQVRELSAKVAALEARYAEAQDQRAALEALYADMSVSGDESALADVEQMLLIAAQQMQLSSNVKVAMIAMQSADARLQRMNRPAFNTLRKTISQDMGKLRALPSVDIAWVGNQLDNLMASIDGLPLAYKQRVATEITAQAVSPKDETSWQKLLREIGQELKQLVRIENTGKAEIPLLPPDQEYFLRENLRLRLMSAHLALMSRDEESFRRELKTAQLWIARHFDGKSNEGMRILSGLKNLEASSIHIELPDVSPSLQAVRNFRLTHENEPGASLNSRTRPR
ncbi:MAG TPA: uroporphyrinogen-III C-methyltransferase [Gallionella sp.]|nr:uroporphyrinogen-III C-methyltransferase [Gallionella sp.]